MEEVESGKKKEKGRCGWGRAPVLQIFLVRIIRTEVMCGKLKPVGSVRGGARVCKAGARIIRGGSSCRHKAPGTAKHPTSGRRSNNTAFSASKFPKLFHLNSSAHDRHNDWVKSSP